MFSHKYKIHLNLEPLLGPISKLPLRGIDWVIVGGESGPGARPMERLLQEKIRQPLSEELLFGSLASGNKIVAVHLKDDALTFDITDKEAGGDAGSEAAEQVEPELSV